jgi:hypothetical protein
MKIRSLFEKDPGRRIPPVVKIDVHDEEIVSAEVEEYVVTDQIRDALNDIVDLYIEARSGRPSEVCAWISGFFGSGKSHFLKMLGYMLTDKKIRMSSGVEMGVAEYFAQKHGIRGTAILAKELKTRPLFVYMLDFDRTKEPDLSRFLFRILLRELGFSEIFWVAEVERMLKRKGLWQRFVDFIEKEERMPWRDVRQIETRVRSALVRGLTKVDPKAYPSEARAEEAIRDAEKEFTMNPEKLARRLLEEAETVGTKDGRFILLLDEVGLYVGRGVERLTELNALAENVEKIGKGKVWIFATAQEAIEQVLPQIEARRPELEWIRDRFRIRVDLRPENIATVVNERLLKKSTESEAFKELNGLYRKFEGTLKMSALIKEPARDTSGLLTRLSQEAFLESYPLMPYHVPLMINVFGVLRSRGRVSPELTGRERAVLQVAKWALLKLVDKDVGALITFDTVYDAIVEELKAIRSEQQALIESEIGKAGEVVGMRVESVAKALFLLQQVGEEIPCTVSNIAAVLYPKLGVDQKEHEEKVRACVENLVKGRWVKEDEGKFRFLTEIERTFEQDVAAQTPRATDKEALVLEVAEDSLKEVKVYNYEKLRAFQVHLWVDDQEVTTVGSLKLRFYTPYWVGNREDAVAELYNKSLAEDDAIFWICGENGAFEDKVKRVLSVEQTLRERERRATSPQEMRELDRYRNEIEIVRNDELLGILVSSARNGLVIYRGEEGKLSGKEDLSEVFSRYMKRLADELFTMFDMARVRVEDEDVGAILVWKAGSLPSVFADLKLVDKDGNISISAPVAHAVLSEVKNRTERGEECTGLCFEENFGAPPYGWDARVVRLTLATLFKNGSLQVESEGRTYVSPEEKASHDLFTRARDFRKARFLLGATVSTEQKNLARRLMSEVLGRGAGPTVEEISRELDSAAEDFLGDIRDLKMKEGFHAIPYVSVLDKLESAFVGIKEQSSYTLKVLRFIDEGTIQPIKEGVPVLSKLKDFVSSGKLAIYRSVNDFVERRLDELVQLKDELRSKGESLKKKLGSRALLNEWGDIYETFGLLKREYGKSYSNLHSQRQKKTTPVIDELETWAKSRKLDVKVVNEALEPLREFLCDGGEKGKYDEDEFVCGVCKQSLPSLNYNIEAVGGRGEKAKRVLVDALAKTEEKKKPTVPEKWAREDLVSSIEGFEQIVGEAKDAVQYGVSRKKKVRVKVEVEREGT